MVLKYIEEGTRWDGFSESNIIASNANQKVVSLHCWCRDILITSQTRAFFGDYFLELEPRMTQLFDDWDINAWMITYQFPKFMAKLATKPRDKLIKALAQYLDAPRERRAGGVPFVNELEDEERNAGLCSEDCARILMIILWGNVQMTTFWTMAHILARPALLARIRHEIAPVMEKLEPLENASRDAMVNLIKSDLVEACPLLDSAVNEVLRVSSTGSSIRKVVKPVNIGGKDLPVGVKVLLPQRPLLLSTQGFGPDAQEVDLLRFLKNKALSRHEYYRPFGGGITMCSGKVLGKRETMAFVVLAIWKYDIEVLLPGQKVMGVEGRDFPRLDERKPSIGIAKQVEGDDMIVKVSPRKR
ncbi:cytochrome P450 protein [Rutstroemia sp. NJR-2017a BBW]|nr:cytochrome P450 protein [Rutstroemia sp. NJR-2017a BBW]